MRQQSITDLAREHLEKAIYTGALQPGDQIKEEPIAEALAISRPPIREAFKLLEGEGLVVRKPRRGVFVARINARDAWEIYTLKAELYDFSITLSFHRLTEDHLDRMGRLVERMEACVRADAPDILSYLKMNGRFHAVHVDAAGHERLKQILGMLHKQIRCFSYQTHSVREHLERSHRYHRDIYNAFKAGDQALAARLTRDHVLAGLKEFQDAPGGKAGRGRGGKDGD